MDKLKLEAKLQMYRITVSTKFNGLTKELKDTFGLFEVCCFADNSMQFVQLCKLSHQLV